MDVTSHIQSAKSAKREFIDDTLLNNLLSTGIIQQINFSASLLYARIFLVKKKNKKSRIIGHPKSFNEISKPPPKLSLLSVDGLILSLQKLKKWHYIEFDLSNYFYQIRVGSHFQEIMAVIHGKSAFAIGVLCQGMNWSPIIAQSISWMTVIFKEESEDALGLNLSTDLSTPPAKVNLFDNGQVIGFVTIIYDNFLIVTENGSLRDRWVSRIKRNLSRFHIVAKYFNIASDKLLFCGIEFERLRHSMQWRTDPTTFCRWQENLNISSATGQSLACMQNILVRHHMVRMENLRCLGRLFACSTSIFQHLANKPKKLWRRNLPARLKLDPALALAKSLLRDASNSFTTFPNTKIPQHLFFFAVDATPTSLGAILMSDIDGSVIDSESFPLVERTLIHLAEALSVTRAMAWARQKSLIHIGQDCLLIFAIDSTTAGRSLSKGWSGIPELDIIVENFYSDITPGCFLFVDVPTDKNVADEVSRYEKIVDAKRIWTFQRMKSSLPLFKKGVLWVDRHTLL